VQLSKREKVFAMVVGVAVGAFLLDYFVLTPWTESLSQIETETIKADKRLEQSRKTMAEASLARRKLRELRTAGLPLDPSMTESKLLNSIRGWAQESRLTLVSLRPDRTSSSKGLSALSFQATGSGSMHQITDFLYRIETAKMPVRVHEVQIASKTEGNDDLTLQVHVSSLWEEAKTAEAIAQTQPKETP
jgi:Tfp pilus assembly protein PilO